MKKKQYILLVFFVGFTCIIAQDPPDTVYQSVTIYTPNGTPLNARELVSGELTQGQKDSLALYWFDQYEDIIFMNEATWTYNCHGYAWHVSEGGNSVWIHSPNDYNYWSDGSYDQVCTDEEATKVSFPRGDHSAITTDSDSLISKWGAGPLFKHSLNDCPYRKDIIKYYFRCVTNVVYNIDIGSDTTVNGCKIEIEGVLIYDSCNVVIDADEGLEINNSFEVELGSSVEFK